MSIRSQSRATMSDPTIHNNLPVNSLTDELNISERGYISAK